MRRLEAIERSGGPRGVGAEVGRFRAPFERLRRDLGAQIATGDAEVAAGTARALTLSRVLTTATVLGLGAVLFMTAALTLTLLRRLKTGLDRLEIGARTLGAGELSHRIALGGRDELAALSDAFDAMAGELQRQQAALKAANSNLEAAVAERTGDLRHANTALAEEDRRRRDFMAYVGHELRTPLTIIRGEAQLALRGDDSLAQDHAPVLGRILEQTRDLERLVDELFLIARAESGGLKLHGRRTDLGELTRRVAADFEALAAEDHAVIRANPAPPVEALVDPDRVRQMMAALIDNALRHTRPGVTVEIAADIWDGAPRITVRDDGPGVPPELTDAMFSRFRRGDHARGQGSGLGLAVVRALAEAHGGAAGLENRREGGACVWLRFPSLQPGDAA
jgi:signal transduction histidine kinase